MTWLLCLPKLTTLGSLLHFTGAFVASAIWPVLFGLYDPRVGGGTAAAAMFFGTLAGLLGYFLIGFYVAALVAAAVSLIIMRVGMQLRPGAFDFQQLRQSSS